MQVSMSIEYAIHGLIYLASISYGRVTLIGEIAKTIQVPESYLRKVFQILSKRGIVVAQRGARGGYYLAREPEEITLKDVVEAMDGSLPLYCCRALRKGCSITNECPIIEAFEKAQERMYEILEETSIKSLAEDLSKRKDGIRWLGVTV